VPAAIALLTVAYGLAIVPKPVVSLPPVETNTPLVSVMQPFADGAAPDVHGGGPLSASEEPPSASIPLSPPSATGLPSGPASISARSLGSV
jgi:hypothetical protein